VTGGDGETHPQPLFKVGQSEIASAERDDADRAALYSWWYDEGRGLIHDLGGQS